MDKIKTTIAEDLKAFRNQLKKQVEGELDIGAKKPVHELSFARVQ